MTNKQVICPGTVLVGNGNAVLLTYKMTRVGSLTTYKYSYALEPYTTTLSAVVIAICEVPWENDTTKLATMYYVLLSTGEFCWLRDLSMFDIVYDLERDENSCPRGHGSSLGGSQGIVASRRSGPKNEYSP